MSRKLWRVTGRRCLPDGYKSDWFVDGYDSRTGNGTNEGPFPRWLARLLVWWYNLREVAP